MDLNGQRRAGVLVVDDEETIAEVVARYLHRAGYDTTVAHDGEQARAAAEREQPELVVLDLMLPRIGGLEVMRRLRSAGTAAPAVILLTARGEEADRISGLRMGADDYVVKPFSPGELVARVDAVLRRAHPAADAAEPIATGDLLIDIAGRRVTVAGTNVALTQREFDLLLFLARNPGQVFSRDQLMEAVWQYSFYSDTSTVTVHVRRLRAKLEPDPASPRWIETVWGVGYRFAS